MLTTLTLANILGFFPEQYVLILIVALLLFGRRLPEMGKSLGKGIVEFKKGLAGIEEDVTQSGPAKTTTTPSDQNALAPSYKFDPYTGKPVEPPAAPAMRFDPYTGKPLTGAPSETTSSNT
jgi:sec-independent protein translocase protein TatA